MMAIHSKTSNRVMLAVGIDDGCVAEVAAFVFERHEEVWVQGVS